MATVRELLLQSKRPIPRIGPDATVLQAAKLMNEYKVGALVVCEADVCKGIFTERDLLRCFASNPHDLQQAVVAEVMSVDLLVCAPDTDIDEARRIMVLRCIRNLPVIDQEGKVIGMVSLADLNAYDFGGNVAELHHLKKYLYSRN